MGRWRDGRGELVVHGVHGEHGEHGEQEEGAGPGSPVPARRVPLEIASSYRARTRGLLGRDSVDGAILLTPANSVHTFRMRIPIDVAYLNRRFEVVAVRTMRPGRLGLPRPRARHVLEAAAGAMAGWGLEVGARVEVLAGGSDDGHDGSG